MSFNISGLFHNQNNTAVGHSEKNAASVPVSGRNQAIAANQSAKSLSPGTSISGQVVSAQDGSVTIKLSDSSYITAALKGGISLQQGSQVSFLVSSNHNNQVTLSPLLTNLLASSPSVGNALNAAGLPVNDRTAAMVTQMMEQGMGIDKDSLHTMYKVISSNPDIESSAAVRLSQMNLAINEMNAEQLQAYDNLNHQISGSIEEIAKNLQELFADMSKTDASEAMELFDRIMNLITEDETAGEEVQNQTTAQNSGAAAGQTGTMVLSEEASGQSAISNMQSLTDLVGKENWDHLLKALSDGIEQSVLGKDIPDEEKSTDMNAKIIINEETEAGAGQQAGDKGAVSHENVKTALQELAKGNMSSSDALKLIENMMQDHKLSQKLLSEPAVGKLLQNALENKWLLKPEDVADKEKMDHFYEQLRSQTSRLAQDASSILGKESPLAQSTTNLSHNIDFMNQLNQTFTYVQIPLKMSGQNANGDLYVYTNKKHLADSDGNVSAFLHLDMDHLGSVDCYVTMQSEKVSTNFKVASDEILDLIEEHIDSLNERLAKRGYSLNTTVAVKEEETSVIEEMEKQLGQGSVPISQVSFDARA